MGLFDVGLTKTLSNSANSLIDSGKKNLANKGFDTTNVSSLRLAAAGLFPGATQSSKPPAKKAVTWLQSGQSVTDSEDADWRLKVSTPAATMYNVATASDILYPLISTGGVIFPITPNINVTHTASYSPQRLTHSNYAMQFYEGSEVASISINATFPIQTIEEGRYLLAAIHFFRAATKMYFGNDSSPVAGTPPPMLFLTGYGTHYFPDVPCVLTNFTHTLADNVDYISIPLTDANGNVISSTRLPVNSQLQLQLQPVYSRDKVTQFSLRDFAAGKLVGGGFI